MAQTTSNKICEFPDCGRPFSSKGLCGGHRRQQLEGRELRKLNIYMKNATPQEKLMAHSEDQGECRVWTGTTGEPHGKATKGHGQIRVDGKLWLAHRLAYTLAYGKIEEGLQIDHRCRVPACIRLEHLQAVTNKVNNENLDGARVNSKTGIRGVTWFKPMKKYRATVGHNGKQYNGGYFEDIKEAEQAAIALRLKLFSNSLRDVQESTNA